MKTESTTSGRFLGADCKVHGALTLAEQMDAAQAQRTPKK